MVKSTSMKSLILLLISVCICHIRAELFTSSAHLQTALYAERDIANHLRSYAEREEARLAQIRRLADDFESHSNKVLKNLDGHIGNPINAFLVIKRFTLDWDRNVHPILTNATWDNALDEINQVRADLPNLDDLKGAAAALMRLQDTYHLDASLVANGDLLGIKSPILSAEECFELGRLAYNEQDFYHTVLWMEQALEGQDKEEKVRVQDIVHEKMKYAVGEIEDSMHDHEEGGDSEDRAHVLDFLAFSHFKLGNLPMALELTRELLSLDPHHVRAGNNKNYFEKMLNDGTYEEYNEDVPGYQKNRDAYRNSNEFLSYEALCRGEETQPVKDAHKLTCRYVTNNHPSLILQPAKEETAHFDPWLVIYHDALSDDEIDTIKELAKPRLNRATVQNSKTGELETANYRISKSAWLRGEEHPIIERINRRMGAITGLDMDTAEELQIANYGLGGQYEPHFDYARKEEKEAFKSLGTGNRIATFLNYLSDVEAGGATVFPYIGLKLYPKKGAAAFWYNLRRSGEGIFNTRHAACPVLVGVKWVANKWIHERGQEFRRGCSLNESE